MAKTKIPKGPGHFAQCQDCGSVVGSQFWSLSKSIGLHKKGTGHKKFRVLNDRASNPSELLLMGANPMPPRKNPLYDQFSRRDRLLLGRAGIGKKDITTEADVREAKRIIAEMSRMKNRLPNPSAAAAGVESPSADHARDLFAEFHAKESDGYIVTDEPHIPAGNYVELAGSLVELRVKPTTTGELAAIQQIGFDARNHIKTLCDGRGKQIYFAGAGQQLTEPEIRIFTDSSADLVELGECRGIVYKAAKWHVAVPDSVRGTQVEWDHTFGEDGGYPPKLFYDRANQRLLLEGGTYYVEGRGIVN
jgi:hypothetical protein